MHEQLLVINSEDGSDTLTTSFRERLEDSIHIMGKNII